MSMPAAVPQSTHQRNPEPSMEEILASIRKIIAEDQKALDEKLGAAPIMTVPLEAAAAVNDDVGFEGEPQVAAEPEQPHAAAAPATVDLPAVAVVPELRIVPTVTPANAAAPAAHHAAVAAFPGDRPDAQPLLSDETAMAAGMAFQALSHTVARPARTMDELVSDMLRPMLSAWLDDNLPALVERLVKAEIERVSRGGR